MLELGYEILEERESDDTSFTYITKHTQVNKNTSINILYSKKENSLIVNSRGIMQGIDAKSFYALKPEVLNSIKFNLEKNALIANLQLDLDIGKDKTEINLIDDILEDGITKDRIYFAIKRIIGFYEFMSYVFREHRLDAGLSLNTS